MKDTDKVFCIVQIVLAVFLIGALMSSCSPEYKQARLQRKHPELYKDKIDSTIQETVLNDSVNLSVHTDTTKYDSLLALYVWLKSHPDTVVDVRYINQEKPFQRKAFEEAVKRQLRKGSYAVTSGEYHNDSLKYGFKWAFNPDLKNQLIVYGHKVPKIIVTKTKTITIVKKPTIWEEIKSSVIYIVLGLVILLLIALHIFK